jgi:hypothetical protein
MRQRKETLRFSEQSCVIGEANFMISVPLNRLAER